MHVRTNNLTQNLWNVKLHRILVDDIKIVNNILFLGYLGSYFSFNKHVADVEHNKHPRQKKYGGKYGLSMGPLTAV